MADVPNRRGRSLPDGGGGLGPRQQVPGSPCLREVRAGPQHPPRRLKTGPPRATDTPSPRPGASSPRPPSQGHSPGREVPVAAAAAAGPSGLAPLTAATYHGNVTAATSAGLRDPETLPSGTASPRPGPAYCPWLRTGQARQTPALNSFPARLPGPGSSVQSARALCRQFPPLPLCPERVRRVPPRPARREGTTAWGVPGPGSQAVEGQGMELTPQAGAGAWLRGPSSLVHTGAKSSLPVPGLAFKAFPEPAHLNLHRCGLSPCLLNL
ncbi:mucin-1-like [Rhinolophus ferrumequinum]|uniref:mucin-1-like n=1 Tax=Rhinolophus ferrumequinum TaxID=59479 RepID=UPI00140FE5AB|nr:mucin-1-like [Rhinolophus ferrumequinum]